MRKSSPSFCQDTPDKESRRRWEVIMIVLTGGKDASSAYCLTTALYCPLPGQYSAIARHKTIRRERKNPHSLIYSSPFTKSADPPINTGVPIGEEWRTTLHLDILFIRLRWVNRAFLLHWLRTDFKRKLDLFGLWRRSNICVNLWNLWDIKEWNLWDIKK